MATRIGKIAEKAGIMPTQGKRCRDRVNADFQEAVVMAIAL
jgi:hypothetical protein